MSGTQRRKALLALSLLGTLALPIPGYAQDGEGPGQAPAAERDAEADTEAQSDGTEADATGADATEADATEADATEAGGEDATADTSADVPTVAAGSAQQPAAQQPASTSDAEDPPPARVEEDEGTQADESATSSELSPPLREAPRPALRLDEDGERPPGFRPHAIPETPPEETRPRDWRYSRLRAQRPQTLPQGAMRMENSKSVGYFGRAAVSVAFSVAAGLHDDFEIGGTPLGLGLAGFFPDAHDPEVYARVRALSGPVQLSFRSNVVFPLQAANTQWGLTAELAWTAEDWLRLDTALDYQMLFDQPFQQRLGVPVALTFQGGINAVTVTAGAYVFNDFDDVDIPLLLRYSVAFGGHQGPVAELGIEGGFLDVIPDPEVAWTARATVTWFAYFGRP